MIISPALLANTAINMTKNYGKRVYRKVNHPNFINQISLENFEYKKSLTLASQNSVSLYKPSRGERKHFDADHPNNQRNLYPLF